ncbi:hypothetical protein [Methylobacterium iners]|uniref:hypothetical protein n=1 Tax=Methylobacterium iners TaxID=418707 RepID=UPI001EE26E28|nr:hypothetical protein [Methylobacterium iners]
MAFFSATEYVFADEASYLCHYDKKVIMSYYNGKIVQINTDEASFNISITENKIRFINEIAKTFSCDTNKETKVMMCVWGPETFSMDRKNLRFAAADIYPSALSVLSAGKCERL